MSMATSLKDHKKVKTLNPLDTERDNIMDPVTALKYGIIDEIVGGEDLAEDSGDATDNE